MRILFFTLIFFGSSRLAAQQALPGIAEKTKGMQYMPGFIAMYADDANGKIYWAIHQWQQELLYHLSLPQGLGSNDVGLDRGLQGGGRIVKFEKAGRKILLVQPNYDYRAVTENASEKKAVQQSFASSTLWGFGAEAMSGDTVLVDATDFLLRDVMQVSSRLRQLQQGNYALDKTRSIIFLPRTKNFPQNTEMEAALTFTNSDGNTGAYVNSVAPSPEAITLHVHHGLVALPDAGYKPRLYDPRSSYIPLSFFDYSSPVSEPIEKKYINRHRLQKKNPNAEKSEPIKPIVYYLDNGTPEPIRTALLEGARWWNEAFEAAGFINAFRVEVLPDTADPMDIRYNMINWVHRSTRGWSYGASINDPRTGEIIKGNVTLGSLRVRQDYLIAQGLLAPFENGQKLLPAQDPMLQMALNRLRQLSAHEVGHTIGLMHNYAASVNNRASVMDYPHPLVKPGPQGTIDLNNAYDLKIGEWDKVAINWGYRQFAPETHEPAALNQILQEAIGRGLHFISDRDARAPGGMHPLAHLWDNGSNPTEELKRVMAIRATALRRFGSANIPVGTPMAMLEDVLVPVYLFHRYQAEAVVKLIGGTHYTYALRGDKQVVTKPLDKATQNNALMALLDCIEPANLLLPDSILGLIPPRPAGYDFTRELFPKKTGLLLDALSPAEAACDMVASLLFHPERLNRLAGKEPGGNTFALSDMLQTVFAKTYFAPRQGGTQALIQQQNEQVVLTYLLAATVSDGVNFAAKAVVKSKLADLQLVFERLVKNPTTSPFWRGHYLLAQQRMQKPEMAKPTLHAQVPPGAPIGCE
ncbi:MAG: DUF5117 domain-containing protein [Bacteroidetes bacterium]|nr:MAG: DUF5117 domain-containing protein [Bacteroidota bacterium]